MEQPILTALVAQQEGGGQGGQGGQGAPQGCAQMQGMLIPILIMFAIIYFLIMRPQQKQKKRHEAMIKALKKGDKVITNAGIFGTITGLSDMAITLEVAKNVHIRILRGQIAGLQPQPGDKETDGAPVVPGESK